MAHPGAYTAHDLAAPPAKRARVEGYGAGGYAEGYGAHADAASAYAYGAAGYAPQEPAPGMYDYSAASYASADPYSASAYMYSEEPLDETTSVPVVDEAALLDVEMLDEALGKRKGFKLTGGAGALEDNAAVQARRAASLQEKDAEAVDVSWPWLRKYRFSTIKAITEDLKFQCRTCGLRFANNAGLTAHMDVHFHINKRQTTLHGRGNAPPARQWYMDAAKWAQSSDILFAEESAAPETNEDEQKDEEAVPQVLVEGGNEKSKCFICGDGFEQSHDDEVDDWVLKGALAFNLEALLNSLRERAVQAGEVFHEDLVIANLRVDVRNHDGDVVHWKCYKHLRGASD